ncbi:MAG: leucine-rich repeat domain-containing protein [Muribaculaceae bacterium]|nr:leucine-rich repeat domain-containing protein [Muribaculaceae bacterium]
MTSTLLKNVERFRYLAILLLAVCGYATADAQLSSDEISEAILVEGSVPVKWTNDAEHPWVIATDDENVKYISTPIEDGEGTTTLAFTYSSTYPTEITFSSMRYGVDMTLEIDGENMGSTYSSWYNSNRYVLTAGTHTLKFISNFSNSYYNSGVRNLRVWECKELESACVKEGSLPLVFEDDSDLENMWIAENGYIRTPNDESQHKLTTTFTVTDRPAVFAYQMRTPNNDAIDMNVYINGYNYANHYASYDTSWRSGSIVLYPGTYTIEFEGTPVYGYRNSTEIRNVRLEQNWYNVKLNNPGELAVRVTQALEGQPLQNMDLLKITGTLNSDDWASVKLLTGIKAIDFTETGITSIPDEGLKDLSYLSTVILPETLKEIGNSAFVGTNFYQISIPASVNSIGDHAWSGTPLRSITFAQDSQLKTIGHSAFRETKIVEFDMPDSVEKLTVAGYYSWQPDVSCLFSECKSLTKLHLSEGLTGVEGYVASGCSSLTEVNIPRNSQYIQYSAFSGTAIRSIDIPESVTYIGNNAFAYSSLESITIPKDVTTIGYEAFTYCENLETAHLNSHCWDMSRNFYECKALKKLILPCATPPTVNTDSYYDPFGGVTKSNVTLVVPDFAFDTYRTNSYWYQFTNTIKGDEASINDYWAIRGTLNLNNTLVMQGNPSVEMIEGGTLTLDANSAQTFNEFTYNTSEGAPAVVLSQSNSVKADRLVSKFYVDFANEWFFFSPVTDVNMSEVSYPATDSWVIRYYDGASRASEDNASGNWKNVPADGTLKSGQGYIFQARETGWLYLPAASTEEHDKFFGANAVTFELADNACETEANAGWNFVANPYPTYYDIYYIDMQAPITVWDGSTYRAYSLNDGDRGDDTFVLRPMQPFFVQKSADTPDLSTGMPLVGRQINTTIDRSRAPRPVVVDENRHKLNLELYCDDNETADDYTRVVLNEQASMAYETVCDASKFMSMDAKVAQLYTLGDNKHPMAINERPYEDGNVALGVLLPAADRTYRISAQRADRQAWLYDAENGIEFDLTEGDYIFTASKTGIDNGRFSIRFAPAVTAVEGVEATAVKVAGNAGSISVSAPAGATVAVYGTDGSIITNTVAENGSLEISVAGGVYVVKVNGESFKTIVK